MHMSAVMMRLDLSHMNGTSNLTTHLAICAEAS